MTFSSGTSLLQEGHSKADVSGDSLAIEMHDAEGRAGRALAPFTDHPELGYGLFEISRNTDPILVHEAEVETAYVCAHVAGSLKQRDSQSNVYSNLNTTLVHHTEVIA